MGKTINILIGGKLGDFLIALQGVKGLCKSHNVKANIFLIDIGWEFGFDKNLTPNILTACFKKR